MTPFARPLLRVVWPTLSLLAGLATSAHAQKTTPPSPAAPAGFEVLEQSILELQAAQADGRVKSRGLVDAYLARIAAYDQSGPRLNSIVTLNPHAREDADALDRERAARGPRGPLHGIPVLVKDNYNTRDMPTSGGALGLATFEPRSDAFQVRRLREAGAVILGKTTMHELAAGILTISSLTGQTRNPYDLARVPGGSSGGTGAAIGASLAAAGMGSDTCGSIRIPAANQNLVGLRGTQGLSSRTGVIPLSSTQDIAGPLARTVTDLALMLDATVGPDPEDPVTREAATHIPKTYRDALRADGLKGARIGVLSALFGTAPEDGEVTAIVRKALEAMKAQGAEVVEVAIPGMDELLRESSVINDEFKFDLADFLAKYPDAPVKTLGEVLERGLNHAALDQTFRTRNLPATRETEHYRQALVKRRALRAAVIAAFEENRLDAAAYPSLRRKPTLIGEAQAGANCQLSATSGLPAISMPAGFSDDGLPIAIEFLGGAFEEPRLLKLAYAWEQAAHPRRPPFSTPALVDGAAPKTVAFDVVLPDGSAPSPAGARAVRVHFTFDQTTGELGFAAQMEGPGADRLIALTLQRSNGEKPGPVVFHLLRRGHANGTGLLTVRGVDRENLVAGRLYLHCYTSDQPLGIGRVAIKVPGF